MADQLVTVFGLLRDGAGAQTTATVRELTGRDPRGLGVFFADHGRAFA